MALKTSLIFTVLVTLPYAKLFRCYFTEIISIEKKSDVDTMWAMLSDWQQGIFYIYNPTNRIVHTMDFVKPVIGH